MLTVDLFSVYLLPRVDIVIRYFEVDFTFGLPGVWKSRKSGSGTGTGTGEINECFKLGSMININTPPPFSTFFARWMMVLGD